MERATKVVLSLLLSIDELIRAGLLSEDLVIEPIVIPDNRTARRAVKGFEPTEEEMEEFIPQILNMEKVDDYLFKQLKGRGLS